MLQYYNQNTSSVIHIYQCRKCKSIIQENPCTECEFDNIKNQFPRFHMIENGTKLCKPSEINYTENTPHIDEPDMINKDHGDCHCDVREPCPIPAYEKKKIKEKK